MHVLTPTTPFPARPMGEIAELSGARSAFASWLRGHGVDQERIADLSVVLSELGANAIRATPPDAPPAAVGAHIADGVIVLEVSNEVSTDASRPTEQDWDLADPLRTGGRGLMLVSAFVDDVDVDVVGRRLVVRCTAACS